MCGLFVVLTLQKILCVDDFVGEWSTSGQGWLYGGNLPKLGEFSNIGLNQGGEPIIMMMIDERNCRV